MEFLYSSVASGIGHVVCGSYLYSRSVFSGTASPTHSPARFGLTMQLIRVCAESQGIESPCVITLGNFDGMHLGHQTLILSAQEIARQKNIPCFLMTFEPSPA